DISIILERVRFWVLCDGECKMLEQGYGDSQIELHVLRYGMTDIEADGVGS
ncbi:Nardilysin, partial [Manis pentadactyla]